MSHQERMKERFEEDIKKSTHLYVDIRNGTAFAFCFEGRIIDFYQKEDKFYFNQDYLSLPYGFFSIKIPWEKIVYENHVYIVDEPPFRAVFLFSSQ